MSGILLQKFKSFLTQPLSSDGLAPLLDKRPWQLATRAAIRMTSSVMATGVVVLAFTGKQFLLLVVSASVLAPFVGLAVGGLIVIYLKSLDEVPRPSPPLLRPPKRTILLLETDPSLRGVLQEGLTNAGFHLICAFTAKHAACLCRDHGGLIDFLLADTNALGSRPLDFLLTIKGPQPDLPVLLISAYDRQTLCEQHAELLASYEFLPLPLEFPHLTETIETLLQLHHTRPDFDLQDQAWNAKPSET
jgi:CheY-like chemotaxis protein